MRRLSERYDDAAGAIDAANADDPNVVLVRGEPMPLALAHGRLASAWALRLGGGSAAPDELVLLAARAHHLRRWELPRSHYPEGRAGYHRWKRDQRERHAHDVGGLLDAAGYDTTEIARVQALVRRDDLATDAGAQTVEDAACLAFLETQLATLAAQLDHERLVEVLRKTARKLSPAGLAAVGDVPLGPSERALLAEALGRA